MAMELSTNLLMRLKAKDHTAWYELWDVFGTSIERMVGSIARRYFGQETIQDIGQETLARVYAEIGRFDVTRGVKFSAWLYGIARHVVLTEITRRSAQKRGGGVRPISLSEDGVIEAASLEDAPADIEASVFRAKVVKAVREVEARTDQLAFESYRMKLLQGQSGREIADNLGVSEPTVSRYLRKVRDDLRQEIARAVAAYSWTPTEESQASDAGLDRLGAEEFDEALIAILIAAEEERRNRGGLTESAKGVVAHG